VSYALIRTSSRDLDLDAFASATQTHPDLVRRLVALGILDAHQDPSGEPRFSTRELGKFARVQRLRASFALNYAAVGLVLDLLDRIAALEAAIRRSGSAGQGGRPSGIPRAPRPGAQPGNYPGTGSTRSSFSGP